MITELDETPREDEARQRRWSGPLFACLVLGALGVFVWNAVETSSARVNATTSANSVFSAGTVDLAQPNTVVELLLDANNLFPGTEIDGCVEIEYRGTIPADVRLHARLVGGTGLDTFIDLRVTLPPTDSCDTPLPAGSPVIFEGTLDRFWRSHSSYAAGIGLAEMTTSDIAVLHVVAGLQDDNDAQGLVTDFTLTVEARP